MSNVEVPTLRVEAQQGAITSWADIYLLRPGVDPQWVTSFTADTVQMAVARAHRWADEHGRTLTGEPKP